MNWLHLAGHICLVYAGMILFLVAFVYGIKLIDWIHRRKTR